MKKFHSILVAIDFSPSSRNALCEAARLAAYDESAMVAVHVVEQEVANAIGQSLKLDAAGVIAHIHKSLEHFIAHAGIGAVQIASEVHIGHPFVSLVTACQKHKADLLIMGSRGSQHGVGQVGAIAAQCVRKAPVEVLLVKEDFTGPHRHVIACVDLSETSAKAVQFARRIAEQDGSRLDCLFVDQSTLALAADYGGYLPALPALDAVSAGNWKKEVDAFIEPLLRNGTVQEKRNIIMERMSVRDAIMEHIRETQASLVVLGTRGKTDLRTLIMGTTAEKVLQRAPCSILAVKPDGFAYHVA
ncbi:MAG: universal stress protein [Verrucomicrobiaceae bacterium]